MDRAYFLLLVVQHFVATSLGLSVSNNNTDLNALFAFKGAIHDPHNIIPTNWSTSTSVCNWIGITCNTRHQRVAAIDLPNMDLVGTIPPRLGNLSFLVHFNIINNSFHGKLPKELAQLRRLKYINFRGNGFDGEFPSWLAAFTRLQYLNFRGNRFSGSLSGGVFNSTNLETIDLGHNLLTGNFPEEFTALPKLQGLSISFNQLSGPLPRSLYNLSSLQIVGLTNNSLSGYLPARICDHLPQLQDIELSLNYFEGEIPSGIGECSTLQTLSLSYNQFIGDIPKGIWNLTTLRLLYLGGNNVTGEIPKAIGNFQNLEALGLENAQVTEYGLEGLVSTRCDVYSFGITLMETFTRKRPNNEMFTEELSLRRWIQESLPDSITQVIDGNLLSLEDEFVKKKVESISSILQLALSCTTDAPAERINIRDVLVALQKIKSQFSNVLKR